jgi:hypothetical protein
MNYKNISFPIEHGYNIGKQTFRTPGTLKLQWCKMSSFEIIARFENKMLSKPGN